jgi:DNA polymerase I-like protein with 3'-5' exonuclease and polymerase domains
MPKQYIFDIETNGVTDWKQLSDLKEVHVLSIYDVLENEMHSFNSQVEGSIEKGVALLKTADEIIGHNVIGFDVPALCKLYKFSHPNITDTVVMSRCIYSDLRNDDFKREGFDKKLIGSHSLKAWGTRLGVYKGDFGEDTDWSTWSQEMEDYCEKDVRVTNALYIYLKSKNPSQQMLKLEHDFAIYMRKQEYNGFPFDVKKAEKLNQKLMERRAELEQELQEVFEPAVETLKSQWWVNQQGDKFPTKKAMIESGYTPKQCFKGDYKTRTIPFNPNSRDQIADRLMKAGWKPKAYDGKRPAINEAVLKDIGTEQSEKLLEYLLVSKRLGAISEGAQAWLSSERNGRIHGSINTCGTVSGRCSHQRPNLGQIPSTNAPYGAECRELFTAKEGHVLVGADASGLELRCLAHYLSPWDKGKYAKIVTEGDVHTANQEAAGLPSRADAKRFIYAWLYGAGDAKIGSIVNGSDRDGRRLKDNFMAKNPAVNYLTDGVRRKVKQYGFLKGLDGRKLPCRSPHSALNLLLQSAGAVIMKQALCEFVQSATKEYEMHANVHDEVQFSCKKEDADTLGQQFVNAIKKAGEVLDFGCPLDGEYSIGHNWKETH